MAYYWQYIGIAGLEAEYPDEEIVQGTTAGTGEAVGELGSPENPLQITVAPAENQKLPLGFDEAFDAWFEQIAVWAGEVEGLIVAAEDAFAQGLEYEEAEIPAFPILELPVPVDPQLPAVVQWLVKIFGSVVKFIGIVFAHPIVREILRRLVSGGNITPLVQLIRYFGMTWEGKSQGEPPPARNSEQTSIHLLTADKPIQILDATGQTDVFLGTDISEE